MTPTPPGHGQPPAPPGHGQPPTPPGHGQPLGGPAAIRPYLQGTVPPAAGGGGWWARSPEPAGPPDGVHPGLRPFILTTGRVRGLDADIGLETQVTARPGAPPQGTFSLPPELQAIITLCGEPMSVAEVSARLRLHLGVTRILVGDLCAAGFLDIHLLDATSTHHPDTILRVIHGLRAIS